MKTMKHFNKVIILTCLSAAWQPAMAIDFLNDARTAWQAYSNGAVKPTAKKASDSSWGESNASDTAPSATPVLKTTKPKLTTNAWDGTASPSADTASAPVMVNERKSRKVSNVPNIDKPVSRASAVAMPKTKGNPLSQASASTGDPADDDLLGLAPNRQASTDTYSNAIPQRGGIPVEKPVEGCNNPVKMLEGLKTLAYRGQEQKAYDGYLALFENCSGQDLMNIYIQAKTNLTPTAFNTMMDEQVMSSPKMARVLYYANIQDMYALNDAGQFDEALDVSRTVSDALLKSNDTDAMLVAGWLEQRAKEYERSEVYFRRVLQAGRASKTTNSAYEGLILSFLGQGKTDKAVAAMSSNKFKASNGIQAEVALAQARIAVQAEDGETAINALNKAQKLGLKMEDSVLATQAWAYRLVGRKDESKAIFTKLYNKNKKNVEYQQGYIESLADSKDYASLESVRNEVSGDAKQRASDVLAELYQKQGRRGKAAEMTGVPSEVLTSRVSPVIGTRNKSGTEGEAKLTHTFKGVNGTLQLTDNLQVGGKMIKHDMNDGVRKVQGTQVEASVAYEGDDATYKVSAGKVTPETPEGKKLAGNAYGSVGVKMFDTDGGYNEVTVFRKPVLDTVRSFAGTDTQGAVMKDGVLFNGRQGFDDPSRYFTYSLEAGTAKGKNVKSNTYYEAALAYNMELSRKGWSWLTVGPELVLKGYGEDNNRFASGYGGYYSPLSQTDIGIKTNFLTEEGKKFLLKGSARAGYTSKSLYDTSVSGMYLEGDVSAGLLVNPYLAVGAGLGLKTSSGYSDSTFWLWANMPFEKRKGLYAEDLQWPYSQ